MDTPGYIKLGEVVLKYIDRAELTTAKYRRLYTMAVDCMSEFNMDVNGVIKTCKLNVLSNLTAELPMDYIQWSKIGVLNSKGEVACLDYNANLTSYASGSPDRINKDQDDSVANIFQLGSPFFFSNYYSAYGYYNLFGISGAEFSKLGGFKIDEKNRLILLQNGYTFDYVILEYLAQPDHDEEYEVPIQLQEALIAWLGYKDIEFKAASRNVSQYDKQRRWNEWLRQKSLAKERMNPFRLQIANQYTRETIKLVPKA